jgi:hypothetical protein
MHLLLLLLVIAGPPLVGDGKAVQGTLLLPAGGTGCLRMTRSRTIDWLITADKKVVEPVPVTAEGGRAVGMRGLKPGVTRITLADAGGATEVYRVIVVPAPVVTAVRALRRAVEPRRAAGP